MHLSPKLHPISLSSSSEPKSPSDFRIIAQNCRGAFHTSTPNEEHYIPSIESIKNEGADIILLSETNTD